MFLPKAFVLVAFFAIVNGRSAYFRSPYNYIIDTNDIIRDDVEDSVFDQNYESVYPIGHNLRVRRQAHGVVNTNPDGSTNIMAKLPLAGNSDNILSATGSGSGLKPGGGYGAAGAGLALDNVNGHGLSLTGKHIPNFGDQLTAAAKVNLMNTDRHNLDANAFVTKNMPNIPNLPDFNTKGVGVDYMFNNKLGASVSAAQTDLFKRTDLSAMGNLNLFRDKTSSLDFNAGATRSFSPYIPKSSWQPNFGLSFSKYF